MWYGTMLPERVITRIYNRILYFFIGFFVRILTQRMWFTLFISNYNDFNFPHNLTLEIKLWNFIKILKIRTDGGRNFSKRRTNRSDYLVTFREQHHIYDSVMIRAEISRICFAILYWWPEQSIWCDAFLDYGINFLKKFQRKMAYEKCIYEISIIEMSSLSSFCDRAAQMCGEAAFTEKAEIFEWWSSII